MWSELPKWAHRTSGPGSSSSPTSNALLRTPCAAEADGGPLHPDDARARGQTLRLTGQVLALTGHLLPTPVAQPSGNTPEEHLRKKPGRVRVTDLAVLVENGLLATGGRLPSNEGPLLPTPGANLGTNGGSQPPEKRRAGGHSVSLQDVAEHVDFGVYAPAIRQWEEITGHPAPPPTEPTGRNGSHRLSARFAEWMMGLAPGWVTDVLLSRTQHLRAIGNGVVPQQAAAALDDMLHVFQMDELL